MAAERVQLGGIDYTVQYRTSDGKLDLKDVHGAVLYGVDPATVTPSPTVTSQTHAATPMDVLSDGTWTVRHEDGSTASITLAGGGWTGHDGWQYQLAGQGSTVSFRWSDGTLQTLAEWDGSAATWSTSHPSYPRIVWERAGGGGGGGGGSAAAPLTESARMIEVVAAAFGKYKVTAVGGSTLRLTHKDNVATDAGENCIYQCCCAGFAQNYIWEVELGPNEWVVTDACDFHIYTRVSDGEVLTERADVQAVVSRLRNEYAPKRPPAGSESSAPVAVGIVVVPDAMQRDDDGPAASAAKPAADIAAKLRELTALKESGALTEEEFGLAKAKALAE